jgi:hypothetical protein
VRRWRSIAAGLGGTLLALALGCSRPSPTLAPIATPGVNGGSAIAATTSVQPPGAAGTTAAGAAIVRLRPKLPSAPGPFAPSQIQLDGALTGAILTETESCAGCHADAAAQWASSAHAFGSFNNPIYRASVDRFRRVVGYETSRFCAGCHDVALLADGAMSAEIAPDDPRARGGITCRVCHGIESARADGNASYVLASTPIPIPRDGDPESLSAHKARMAMPPLRTAAMCGTCHRSFLSPDTGNAAHLVGQDELGAWRRSAYAGSRVARIDEPLREAECRTCHMPLEEATSGDAAAKDGKIHSHRFAGGNSWLAAMRHDWRQLAAIRRMLRGAASIDVAVADDGTTRTSPADGAPVRPGLPITLDVVVRNERVGHRFPGGVLDAQDTWIEVTVTDAHGRRIAEDGAAEAGHAEAHLFRALQADGLGAPVLERQTEQFRTPVFNHTLPPRDAEVVRYRFDVPPTLAPDALPLRVHATIRHRSRNLFVARDACVQDRLPRGAAFDRASHDPTGAFPVIDGCASEPTTDVAETDAWLGGPPPRAPSRSSAQPLWRRLYDHALGLSHALQEDVEGARVSLDQALAATRADGLVGGGSAADDLVGGGSAADGLVGGGSAADGDLARAMILQLAADVAARQGRTAEALDRLDRAESLAPGHPALARARADALGAVWRWREAMDPMERAARAAPLDDGVWARLAIACGSAGDPAAALDAAAHGLELGPRDADMLRVQALALEALGASPEEISAARAAFSAWRPPDDAPGVKNACAARLDWCARERVPVHVHRLRPVAP